MPSVAVARDNCLSACSAVVDSQVQGNGAVASSYGSCGIDGRVGGSCVGVTMPCVAVARGYYFNGGQALADGKMECCDTVATSSIQ